MSEHAGAIREIRISEHELSQTDRQQLKAAGHDPEEGRSVAVTFTGKLAPHELGHFTGAAIVAWLQGIRKNSTGQPFSVEEQGVMLVIVMKAFEDSINTAIKSADQRDMMRGRPV